MIKGIDIAAPYQKIESFDLVKKAGYDRVVIKATEGIKYRDPIYQNFAASRYAGLDVGFYHFWRPNDDAGKQAEWFLMNIDNSVYDRKLLVLDFETIAPNQTPQQNQDAIAKFLEIVSKESENPAIIYTNPSTWKAIGNPSNFSQHPLWIADFGVSQPEIPASWKDFTGWQYKDNEIVPGIDGETDVTVWVS